MLKQKFISEEGKRISIQEKDIVLEFLSHDGYGYDEYGPETDEWHLFIWKSKEKELHEYHRTSGVTYNEKEYRFDRVWCLDDFIESRPQIRLWLHGHTHHNFNYWIGETRVVCNPRGYVGHESMADWFQLQYLEV
jgi:hypothetical protein